MAALLTSSGASASIGGLELPCMPAGFAGWHAPGSRDRQQGADRSAQTWDDDCHIVAPAGCAGLLQWWFITPVRREEYDAAESVPHEAVDEVMDDHLQRSGPQ